MFSSQERVLPPPTPANFLVQVMSKAPESKEKATVKKLAAAQWAEAQAMWELGSVSLTDLSDRYGLARETFSRKFKKLGIIKGSRAAEQADRVRQEIEKTSITDATILAERAKATKDDHYNWATLLARMAMLEISNARNENRAISTVEPAMKAIDKALSALSKARLERWKCLGLDDETFLPEDLPDLTIKELTAEDIEEMRERGFGDMTNESLADDLSDLSDLSDLGLDENGDKPDEVIETDG